MEVEEGGVNPAPGAADEVAKSNPAPQGASSGGLAPKEAATQISSGGGAVEPKVTNRRDSEFTSEIFKVRSCTRAKDATVKNGVVQSKEVQQLRQHPRKISHVGFFSTFHFSSAVALRSVTCFREHRWIRQRTQRFLLPWTFHLACVID